MSYDVVGLGNALMDALVVVDHADELLSELGLIRGTMHMVADEEWQRTYQRVVHHGVALESGGSCANTIATLGRLGARSLFAGQVGSDELGHTYAQRLTDACGGHALHFTESSATGKCLALVAAEDAERTMLTDLGAAVSFANLPSLSPSLLSARVAHFEGYTLLDGPMRPVVLEAMRAAHAAGVTVSLDAADPFVVLSIRELLWEVVKETVDVLFLNAEEARALTDHPPEEAAEVVASQAGVRTVVVKLGSRGSIVLHEGMRYEIGIDPVHAIDTTGAGDAYAGGFLYGLLQGWSPDAAGRLGAAVAAATVSQIGAVVKDSDRLAAILARVRPD